MADDNNQPVNIATLPLDPQQVLDKERSVCQQDPTTLIRLKYMYIKDKKKDLEPLIPNKVQQMILAKIRAKRVAKKPVRMAILKGRQFGVSTLVEALIYGFGSQVPNSNSLIMADDEEGSNYLFRMCKLYDEELRKREPHLAPEIKYSNERKLEFEAKKSIILIETGKNKDAGRLYTFHNAHLSECARYPYFEETMLSLMQGVPDLPETFVFLETTADGENEFCEWWRQKEEDIEAGKTDWELIFLSWKDHEEYNTVFVTESERDYFIKSLSIEDKEVMNAHGLTLEQMHWRQRTITNKCGGKLEKFHQEYPLTADEAFITSGKRVFPEILTAPHERYISTPLHEGNVVYLENRGTFIPMQGGNFKMYKGPLKGHTYVIASDSSDGLPSGDPACAQVLDRSTWEQVGVLHGQIPPDIFGDNLFALGAFYNWAFIIPEINNQGLVTVLRLRDLFYPRVATHERVVALDPGSGKVETTDELGWRTTEKNKPVVITDLQSALREMLIVLHDKMTLKEIKHFSVLRDGKYGGSGGHHDDRVMSLMIAVHFAKKLPELYSNGQSGSSQEARSKSRTGY